ncbi:hypothetical protein ACFSQ7_19290 [Paenibacillus rhizoplanae]
MFREWELPSSAMGKSSGKKGFGVLEKGKARPVKVNTVFPCLFDQQDVYRCGGL